MNEKERFRVALFNMPYRYHDPDFAVKMSELGLKRGESTICGLPHKAILANNYEYWLDDYDDENVLVCKFGFIPTYTVEDFVSEIKRKRL